MRYLLIILLLLIPLFISCENPTQTIDTGVYKYVVKGVFLEEELIGDGWYISIPLQCRKIERTIVIKCWGLEEQNFWILGDSYYYERMNYVVVVHHPSFYNVNYIMIIVV